VKTKWLLVSVLAFLAVLGAGLVARGSSDEPGGEPTGATGRQSATQERRAGHNKDEEDDARSPIAISFWDENRGLAGTGRTYGRQTPGRILLTEDGGNTFRVVLRANAPVDWVDTAGDSDAWAVVQDRHGRDHRIMHSSDGGRSWERLPQSDVWDPSFANPSVGLGLAGSSTFTELRSDIVSTADGGRTWKPSPDPCSEDWFVAVDLVTEFQAWALCTEEGATGIAHKTVFRSGDGGETWRRVAGADESGERTGGLAGVGYPAGIDFSPGGLGVTWWIEPSYVSRDGGENWEELKGLGGSRASVVSAAMLSDRVGYVIGGGEGHRRLLITRDAWATWEIVHKW
jgi:photosystem II stability/assembly factor-like uncharacterized protein